MISCRNSVVCFACQKTGHRSFACPELAFSIKDPSTSAVKTTAPLLPSTSINTNPSPKSDPSSSLPSHSPTIAMLPPPNFPLITEANTLPILLYYAISGTIKLWETLSQGLILHDTSSLGPIYIQDNLHHSFPFLRWTWIARELLDNQYFVLPPPQS